MLAIVYLLLGCLPPLIAGPLAGIAYISILKREKMGYLIPFWALLVLLNLLVMFWVASSSGKWFPIASLSAFFVTPVASIITIFVMRNAWHRLEATKGVDVARKGWFSFGLVLIPALQLGMFAALIIYGPLLCKVGLVICRGL
ncbi:MAG: hypothetical protein ABSF99_10440 [Anaerolineales bacterium]|jgi:membrane protein YdbS with pleckstrin-like domain